MRRPVIAIDLDDVLSASADGFAAYSNERWGGDYKPENYLENWAIYWGVSLEEALKRSKEYHSSDAVVRYRHSEPAVPVLRALRPKYDLVVVTSRRISFKQHTDTWLQKHFPNIFREVRYAGIWDASHQTNSEVRQRLSQTKTSICRDLGADYLIDDQPKHCFDAAESGVQAVLFGDYKWNKTVELPKGVTRVSDWDGVRRYFNAAG
jgi:5'(3')-deoxyribonucleotidase